MALRRLALRAYWAAEQRLVHLVQERLGPDLFAYLAIARPKPKHAEVSLAALLVDARSRLIPRSFLRPGAPNALSAELSVVAGPARPAAR